MTDDEFNACSALIRDWFKGQYTADEKDSYRIALGDLPGEHVLLALKKLLAAGQVFTPKPGEIIAAIEHDPGVPTWAEAQCHIFATPATLRRRGAPHPALAAFIDQMGGLDTLRLLPIDDPQDGKWERKRLREQYTEHLEAWDARREHTFAIGRGDGGPRRLDPISAVGLVRDELTEGEAAA
jgi:hypothetical protein